MYLGTEITIPVSHIVKFRYESHGCWRTYNYRRNKEDKITSMKLKLTIELGSSGHLLEQKIKINCFLKSLSVIHLCDTIVAVVLNNTQQGVSS